MERPEVEVFLPTEVLRPEDVETPSVRPGRVCCPGTYPPRTLSERRPEVLDVAVVEPDGRAEVPEGRAEVPDGRVAEGVRPARAE